MSSAAQLDRGAVLLFSMCKIGWRPHAGVGVTSLLRTGGAPYGSIAVEVYRIVLR